MICIDGSNYSDFAFHECLRLAKKETDEVALVTVYKREGEELVNFLISDEDREDHNRTRRREAETVLEKYYKQCKDLGYQCEMSIVGAADPRDTLVHIAENLKVDVVCVGTRGMSFLKKLVLGSVTEYLLNYCQTDLLVTHAPAKHT